jgi:HK97 family phage major capsid protein
MRVALIGGLRAAGYIPMLAERHGFAYRGRPVFEMEGGRGPSEVEIKGLAGDLKKATDEVKSFAEKYQTEIKNLGDATGATKQAADKALVELGTLRATVTDLEQKMARRGEDDGAEEYKSAGQIIVETDEVKSMLAQGERWRGKVNLEVKAITSANSAGSPTGTAIAPSQRLPGVIDLPRRRLTIRDLLAQGRMTAATLDYAKENVVTNAAATVAEGALKPESNITYTMATATARVIAHWIAASKQILSDAPALQSMIDSRLRYGLASAEETQILMGDGTGQNLLGLVPQATAYAPPITEPTGFTKIDRMRHALLQVALAEYPADGIVMNPIDWATIEELKDTQGRYIIGNPQGTIAPTLWGQPVLATQAMTVNTWLTGSFQMAAQIWDRWDATVLISTENVDNFVKNMVTILAEERLALAVYRPAALVKGNFTFPFA